MGYCTFLQSPINVSQNLSVMPIFLNILNLCNKGINVIDDFSINQVYCFHRTQHDVNVFLKLIAAGSPQDPSA